MVNIQAVGTGCPNCEKLAASDRRTRRRSSGGEDHGGEQIRRAGGLLTPGLLINGQLMSSGKIPTKSTLKAVDKRFT
ncbi:MAG: thioredoxin family protein [bacterium]